MADNDKRQRRPAIGYMESPEECWLPVVGYEDLYAVSDRGQVRNLSGQILKPGVHRDGYLTLQLCKDGKGETKTVHRLVASAFIPNPSSLPEVNHLDLDKANNAARNLEWISHRDNQIHAAAEKRQRRPAIGYIRQSSATNVGEGKDGEARQRRAIQAYANKAGYKVVEWIADLDVPGTDPIDMRPGFSAALELIAGNGVRTIIVETANRFARDLMVQEAGCQRLKAAGIALIAADKPDSFTDDTPTAKLVRQILGAVAEFDKAMLVAKLAGARQRKRRQTGKCGGRKNYMQIDLQMVALARYLRGGNDWRPYSLRVVSAELAAYGYVTRHGKPYSASAVQAMLG